MMVKMKMSRKLIFVAYAGFENNSADLQWKINEMQYAQLNDRCNQ